MLTSETAETIEEIRCMEVRDDDIWVVTYPKSGTTWMQELVWQVVNNFNTHEGKAFLGSRFPFLEADTANDTEWLFRNDWWFVREAKLFLLKLLSGLIFYRNNIDKIADMPRNKIRFIKTHLPLELLPDRLSERARVIYVARNPHDTMLSYFHHSRNFAFFDFQADIATFANMFMSNQVMYGPYFPHVESAWKCRQNILFVWYEEMKTDLDKVITRVEEFLKVSLENEKRKDLLKHLHIDSFRSNPSVNLEKLKSVGFIKQSGSFIRKGKCGGWVEETSDIDQEEMNKFNTWVIRNIEQSDVVFPSYPSKQD